MTERLRIQCEELSSERIRRMALKECLATGKILASGRIQGRGIVICGGGWKYFGCAYVCIRALREIGCKLPIELWCLSAKEISVEMADLLKPLNVECIDASKHTAEFPVRRLGGWELKNYALIHSRFQEVLLLDADNVAIRDPEYLFESEAYKRCGAIFWPDFRRLGPERSIWSVCGVEYRDEPEFESGQIVVDKERCWHALHVAMHMNEHSDYYYKHMHGDKETFHMAWRLLNQEYAMPERGIHAIPYTMCQHDFEGRRLFQHRNMDKWRIGGGNAVVEGFEMEDKCRMWLEELERTWDPTPHADKRFTFGDRTGSEYAAWAELTQMHYEYHRVGFDRRKLTFMANGRIGEGARGCEVVWNVRQHADGLFLDIFGEHDLIMSLARDRDGIWRGKWLKFEKMPVELIPIGIKEGEERNR